MSTVNVELPLSLQKRLEQLAQELNVSVADLLVEAADKMSQIDTLEKVKQRAQNRNTRDSFNKVLDAVPDAGSVEPDDVVK